jgi:hypothetical protein
MHVYEYSFMIVVGGKTSPLASVGNWSRCMLEAAYIPVYMCILGCGFQEIRF